MVALTIQYILLIGYAAFEQTHPLQEHVRKAAHKLMVCRTSALGGHVQGCPDNHFIRVWYNSCKHRMCPLCAYLQIQRWLTKQKARILSCDHFHVIFTMPSQLRPLWRFNKKVMNRILFNGSRDTLFELLSDDNFMGGKPGIISSLHTWTKTLLLHPHIHCLVTGCGLNPSGELVYAVKNFLLPYDLIKHTFRRHVRTAILEALDNNEMVLPDNMRPQQLRNILNKLGRIKWNVRICDKYPHGKGVLMYLARYVRGGPISNQRIVAIKNGEVTFNYGRKKPLYMTLSISDFIERFLQHIPEPNAILVRAYGLYSPRQKKDLENCRKILGQPPIEDPLELKWQDCFKNSDQNPDICPICGKRLIALQKLHPLPMIHRSGLPPPPILDLREAA